MNRFLIHILSGVALAFSLAASALAQETFSYPEDFPPRALQAIGGVLDSLAPTGSDSGKSASLSGNRVIINSGTIGGDVVGAVNLNDSNAVTDNHVTINNGTVNRNVDGGHGATASGNSVTIYNGTMEMDVIGGHGWGVSGQGSTASGNRVFINGGTFNRDIYGGLSQSEGGGSASATNNIVTISGGTINGVVMGGIAEGRLSPFATNNTVIIRGAPTFGSAAILYGGNACFSFGELSDANNSLNLHSAGLTVHALNCFQNLNFYLPTTLKANGTMLTATDSAVISSATKVSVGFEGAGPSLRTGDKFILIKAGELRGDFQPTTGALGGYHYTVQKEGNHLVLVIGDELPGPTRQYTGQWIKADEDAWGLSVFQNFPGKPRYLFVPWFTYDKSGKASWYVFQGDTWSADDTISAEVYRYTGPNWGATPYDNNKVTNTKVGTAKLTFTSAITATFEYEVEGASRTIDLQKLE